MCTARQKLVASKMVENGGNLGKAMIEAGYSKAMAKNPYKLMRSKGWLEATNDILSDEKLFQVHAQLLDSVKIKALDFPRDMSDKEIISTVATSLDTEIIGIKQVSKYKICFYTCPDYSARLKAVELAYKVKGRLSGSRHAQRPVEDQEELEETVKRFHRLFPDSDN